MNQILIPSPIQSIIYNDFEVIVKRDDLINPYVSGNKYRKLIGNISYLHHFGIDQIITFGGAFSNHIYATAAAGAFYGFETIGIIRGEELNSNSSSTLKFAKKCGMKFEFWPRFKYKHKDSIEIIADLKYQYPNHFIIPEGGTNIFSSEGLIDMVDEIFEKDKTEIDYFCTAIGTGGTVNGILASNQKIKKVLGFSSIKNPIELNNFIRTKYLKDDFDDKFIMNADFHFGGYAKKNEELISFITFFENKYQIPLDEVYVSKMFFGIFRLIDTGFFKKSDRIVALHTGGLQGRIIKPI